MGNPKGEYDSRADIVYKDRIMVRHNALEAARIQIQKRLEKEVGLANYHFKVNVFPHHVMRENVTATGAGADRVSEGMRKSYGKPIGRAARVKGGQAIITVRFAKTDSRIKSIKKALKLAANKLPGDKSVKVSDLK
jgi:large subunit ribosomal protein L10e